MDEISEAEFHERWGVQISVSGDLLRFEDVRLQPLHHVWTVVDSGDNSDGNWYAIPGFHVVNNLGYVLTAKPWDFDTPQAIYFLDDLS